MRKTFKNILCICLAVIMTFSAAAAAIPTLAAKKEPLHNEKDFYDFSEMNVITRLSDLYSDAYHRDYSDGGNASDTRDYLASWAGPVDEASHPYAIYDGKPEYKNLNNILYADDVLDIPHDLNSVKKALTEFGALYCGFDFYDSQVKDGKYYYYPKDYVIQDSEEKNPHAVTVIGWDDNFPKENFVITPERDGAIICKNSWGTSHGDDGYIYISYCDRIFSPDSYEDFTAFTVADADCGYNKIYQYDEFGTRGPAYSSDVFGTINFAANVFPEEGKALDSNEILRAVSFYTFTSGTSYDVYLVEDYKDSGDLKTGLFSKSKKIASGKTEYPGYHVVDLDNDYTLKKGTRFAIMIKLSDKNYACEYSTSKAVRGNKGESFYKSGSHIIDLNDNIRNSNWCIKAFTEYTPAHASGSSPDSLGNISYFGIDNVNRKYESDVHYTLEELVKLGIKINPRYIEYMNNPDGREVVPSPVVFNNTATNAAFDKFPEKYDLRDYGLVSTVKDQGYLGSCWAHASLASLESNALKKYSSGNGVFDSFEILKTRKEQTADIAPGGEAVYKFTAPKSADYTFTVSGERAKGELCTAFGIVVDETKSKSVTRYMAEGETLYLRTKFADAEISGKITAKADTRYLYDEDLATVIKPGSAVKAVTSDDKYDIYKIFSDEEFDGRIEIVCDSDLLVLLDGREITLNDFHNIYLHEKEPSALLEILPVSGGGIEYEIQVFPHSYYIAEVYDHIDIYEGTPYICNGDEDEDEFMLSFSPVQDDFYTLKGDCYNYSLYYSDGNYYETDDENYKHGYLFMEAGKTYFLKPYSSMYEGASFEIVRWKDAHDGIITLSESKEYTDVLYNTEDVAEYSFTAEEDGYYRFSFYVNSDYDIDFDNLQQYDIALYDENGNSCGNAESIFFFSLYIYDYIKSGETRYLTVKQAVSDSTDESSFDATGCEFDIVAEKSRGGSFDESLLQISKHEVFEVKTDEAEDYYKFIPEKTGYYYFRTNKTPAEGSDYCYLELTFRDSDFNYLEQNGFEDYTKVYLTESEIYYLDYYSDGIEKFSIECIYETELELLSADVLTLDSPVNAMVFGNNEEDYLRLPVRADKVDDPESNYLFITVTSNGYESHDSIALEYPYSLQEIESVYDPDTQTTTTEYYVMKYEAENDLYYYFNLDNSLETTLILPGSCRYSVIMEFKEDDNYGYYPDDVFLSGKKNLLDYSLIFKETYTVETYFNDYEGGFRYYSSNEDVATVDENGVLTAVGIGSAVITVETEDGTREAWTGVNVKYSWWQQLIRIFLLGFIWY